MTPEGLPRRVLFIDDDPLPDCAMPSSPVWWWPGPCRVPMVYCRFYRDDPGSEGWKPQWVVK
jgi:hypothetical protein